MKGVLLNENMPARLAAALRDSHVLATHVCDVGLNGQADSKVWSYAMSTGLAVLTKDSDYLDMALAREEGKVVLVTVGNMRLRHLIDHVKAKASSISMFLDSEDRILVI